MAIRENLNLNGVGMSFTCTDVEQEEFFTDRGRKYKFKGRFDFY